MVMTTTWGGVGEGRGPELTTGAEEEDGRLIVLMMMADVQ